MSDPAVEAAQRAYSQERQDFARPGLLPAMEAAAREMAKSVQELHRPTGWGGECVVCFDSEGRGIPWPCETAKRVYPSEELGL
ncbi:hypothetical protein DDJ46_17825 [Mycobacteroides abscessus]|nr:hypothetical protein DDJ46_17825 [Mycobacteroides abscessus]